MIDPDMDYIVDFVCPHCSRAAEVWEEDKCPVSDPVDRFSVVGWEEDHTGKLIAVDDVEIDYGKAKIHEPDGFAVTWVCSHCLTDVDESIRSTADLFNWLYKNNMLREQRKDEK